MTSLVIVSRFSSRQSSRAPKPDGGYWVTTDEDSSPVTAAVLIAAATPRAVTGHADGRVLLWEVDASDRPRATSPDDLPTRAPSRRWRA